MSNINNSMSKSYKIDMCEGAILPKMLMFALPLMASSMLQLLFNAADVLVVGKFVGEQALAAVGSNGSLINLLTNFFMGLSVGANVLVARFFASKQKENLEKTIHTAMTISLLSGLFLTVIGIIGARQILVWMQSPDDVLPLATLYLRIYFLGMSPMMMYNFGSAILRAVGDTKRPLYFLTVAGVINVVLNLIFVIYLRMSVVGVAIATIVSQAISAGLIIVCLIKDEEVHLDLHKIGIEWGIFGKILQIGLPASVQGMVFSFSNVIIQSAVNSFGTIVIAGNAAAITLEGFVYVAMNSFHQAAISFTSQNLGAGKKERLNRILLDAEICAIVAGLVLGELVVRCGTPLLSLYTSSKGAIAAGQARLDVICRLYALCGMMDVVVGVLRGLGHSVLPMIVSIVGVCGVRLVWIFTAFQWPQFHTTFSLYMTYPVSWTVTIIAHFVCYYFIRKKLTIQKHLE